MNPDNLTLLQIAIAKGYKYATEHETIMSESIRFEGTSLHAVLRNAYQQGYLDGFTHRLTGEQE